MVFSNDLMPRNGDQFYPFRQNSNFFYLTGIEQPNTILLLSGDKEEGDVLFLEEPSAASLVWEGEKLTPEEASELSGTENIKSTQLFDEVLSNRFKQIKTVCFDLPEEFTFSLTPSKTVRYYKSLREKFPFHSMKSVHADLVSLRLLKEPEEIELIRHAIHVTGEAFQKAAKKIQPGLNEKEIEAMLTYEFAVSHTNGHAYDPIVASGANACTLHYIKNDAKMKSGALLLMDFGAEYKNYASDISRTLPVNGTFSTRQRELYQAVMDVMDKAIEALVPGRTVTEVNRQVTGWLIEKHIELGLYTKTDLEARGKSLWKKYFPHGISHFIGLDVHDCGTKDQELEPGMVLSCEPGLYIPEEETGIRIEDDILIGREKPENLSSGIPKTIREIEQLMR